MSGRKTVTIDSYDLDRLRRMASQATTLSQANAALNRINQNLTDSVNNANRRINTLNSQISNLSNNLSSAQASANKEVNALRRQLQAAVRDSNQRLTQLNQEHQQQLQTLETNFQTALDQTRTDVADAMSENNRRIEEAMNENNRIISDQINHANDRINAIDAHLNSISNTVTRAANDLNTLHQMAEEFAGMAQVLISDSENYRCELLLPGQLGPVKDQLATALYQITLSPAAAPAAQLAAYNAYLDALAFHERIIQAEQEWILRHQAAQQAVAQAQARIEASRQVVHEPTKVPIDVDYWTNGDLSNMASEANDLMRHLEEGADNDSVTDLDEICATGQWLATEVLDTTAFALGAAENSQFRVNIAQALSNTLRTSQVMRIVDHGYQGNDMRSSHRVRLRNAHTGLELVITQTPQKKPNGDLENTLEVEITEPGSCNADIAHEIAGDICQALQRSGSNVGSLDTVPGCSDIHSGRRESADLAHWRTETAAVIKPQHKPRPIQDTATGQN